MKRGYFSLLFAAFLLLMPFAAAKPGIEIVPTGYSPAPVDTGNAFILSFDVKNTGAIEAKNIVCNLDLKYGLSASGTTEKNIGSVSPGKNTGVEYEIMVSEDAARGSHNIKINCKEEGGTWISKDALIEVKIKYGTLNVANVRTEPKVIEPGQKATLYIALENAADYLMNEITVKLNLTGVDIAPYGESAEKKIKSISAKSSEDVSFGIVALPKIAGGIYKIPLDVTYKDVTTKSYAVSSFVSIEVGSKPQIGMIIESSSIYGTRKVGNIILKIVNRGLTDIKLLNIKLQETNDFMVLSSDEAYIGNVDSDNYETTEFKIKLATNKKEIIFPLLLEFRDSSNNLYSQQENITFRKLSSSEAGESTFSVLVFIPIILAIATYLFYRHRKKRKKQLA